MTKLWLAAAIFIAPLAASAANGQSYGGYVAPDLGKPAASHLLDHDHRTSTGETVPWPGVPQSSGETTFDHYIERENNRIDNSICNDC
jgi:hypothetical protein